VAIRDAKRSDSPVVAALLDQLGYPASPGEVERRLERLRSTGADRIFVAELEGQVVGLAALHVSASIEYDRDAGKVSAIVVDEKWRRRGVGEALMRQVLRWAEEERLDRLVLHASDAGRALYERLGFVGTNEMRYRGPGPRIL
jgi:N-acetylglutamate synthase-like GNAT family acetyltransferase